MGRSAAGLTVTWLLSCAPVALPALWEPAESALGDASRAALAVVPWLAWIGMPGSRASPIGTALVSVPPLAAAVAIDLGHGRRGVWLACVALASLAMIVLLGLAAHPGPRSRAFAWAWMMLVPGLPLLRCALELGGAPAWGTSPRWLAWLADASPIAWAWACARPGDVEKGVPIPWAGLAVCVALLAITGLPRTRAGDAAPQEFAL